MKILFLDEAGDHNLLLLDKDYPIFVLGGCILDEKTHLKDLTPSLKLFKEELFDDESIILHFRDYARSVNGFEKMRDKNFRDKFYQKIANVITSTDMAVLGCIIDKKAHKEKYELRATDPYLLSLEILVEKFVLYLKDVRDTGMIIAESRSPQLDNELNLAYLGLKISGTRFIKAKKIAEHIKEFVVKKKEENIAGLQLIDSIVSPIGRKYLGYKDYLDYRVIENKFRKNKNGVYMGYGLVMMPKKLGGPRNGSDHPYKSKESIT